MSEYKFEPLKIDDVTFKFEVEPDCNVPVKGNVLASGDEAEDLAAEKYVQDRLDNDDIYAWCCIKVTASWNGYSYTDYLGGVTLEPGYQDIEEYAKDNGMHDEALLGLNDAISSQLKTLLPRIKKD